jgi:hypothetical protein
VHSFSVITGCRDDACRSSDDFELAAYGLNAGNVSENEKNISFLLYRHGNGKTSSALLPNM